ncbi:dihydrofolate reductase family protein [Micromonospora sp. NPDC047707]|uniref:dihydrofolate reductase family protein n=1 Tax=Micromonospora sp. NPDC047707 TaxID=3154498 RepID=UPI00345318D2
MRLTITTFLTLDGVIQAPGGPDEDRSGGFDLGGWGAPLFDDSLGAYMGEVFTHADGFLLGRRTYDIFAAWWPQVTDPRDPIAGPLNRLPKHVATTRGDELTWPGTQRLTGDLATAVGDLKRRPGRELRVHGSGALAQSLMREGLIDTYRLLIFPVVLGRGRRLFADAVPPAGLWLTDSRTSGSGVTMLTYDHAGAPEFGTVGG